MLGAGELLQQGRIGSCCAGQSCYGGRGLEDAGTTGKTDGRCHLTSLGRRAELADLQTLAQYHVQEILGSRRRMPKGSQSGAEGPERGTWRSHSPISTGMGLLRRSFQRQKIRIPAAIRQLRDGKHPLQSLISRYVFSSSFNFQQR